MDVIEPKDTPETPKDAAQEPPKQEPFFQSAITKEGVMTISVDIKAAISSDDHFYTMRGFIDAQRDRALALVMSERARLNQEKQKIILANNKNGHRSFVNRIMGR